MKIELGYTKPQQEIFFGELKKYNIVTKGRRFGLTKGFANFTIESLIEGKKVLWGDTIHGNIERYFDRYFIPELRQSDIPYRWEKQSKVLTIFNGHCDFRSSDKPENWEGFGYDIILLNEAGIILKNSYLYTNAILPMLLDNPESILIAGGVPKGKITKKGDTHPFYTLFKRGKENESKYRVLEYSSYDNPLLQKDEIENLEKEILAMSPEQVQQEIYGSFIEMDASNPFAVHYESQKHEAEVTHDPKKQLIISIDFNLNPFGVIFSHIWTDREGDHCHIFDETSIVNGSIPEMADEIKLKYKSHLFNCIITGDSMGKNRDLSQRDHASHYTQLKRALNLRDSQIKVPQVPTHQNSREDCNYILYHFPDLKINPVKCPNTVRDMKIVQCDAFGTIIKKNRKDIAQHSDFLDMFRYTVNTFLYKWIKKHQRGSLGAVKLEDAKQKRLIKSAISNLG